ncbi:gp16 family protein [Marinomonas gallaica]|uniref:gp16 family protein n=1 Tax=Marinomonas gallaica TaxID=1806667 RepID=UPI003CE5C286
MDDESYRLLLNDMFGKRSAKDLTEAERGELLERFKQLGFVPKKPQNKATNKTLPWGNRPNPNANREPPMGKIEALLVDNNLPWAYADGIAKQMFKVEKVDWLERGQLRKVVAALAVHSSNTTAQ